MKNLESDFSEKELAYFEQGVGGNRLFYDFMKRYNLENESIKTKYESYPAVFWSKMLRSRAKKEEFNEEEPPTNWKDNVNYYMKEVKGFFARLADKGKRRLIEEQEIYKGQFHYAPDVSDREKIQEYKEQKQKEQEDKLASGEIPAGEKDRINASPDKLEEHRKSEAQANKE